MKMKDLFYIHFYRFGLLIFCLSIHILRCSYLHFTIFNNHIIYAVQFEYQKHEYHDCLVNNDLHSVESDGTPDHENCNQWCSSNSVCEAFTVYKNTCYFKSHACGNNLIKSSNVLYMKRGNNALVFRINYMSETSFTEMQRVFSIFVFENI